MLDEIRDRPARADEQTAAPAPRTLAGPAAPAGTAGGTGRSLWIAAALVAGLVVWMASGMWGAGDAGAPPQDAASPSSRPVTVASRASQAAMITRYLVNQAEVAPRRDVPLRAGIAGRVAELPVAKGARVGPGDLLVRLDPGDRPARLRRAQAEVARYEGDYEAARRLAGKGYAAAARERETFAQLQAARAEVDEVEEEIANATIEAPFAGILNRLDVERGEYVRQSDELGRLVENDPLVVEVQVAQQNIAHVREGMEVEIAFVTGQQAKGTVRYVSANADRATHTFLVEVEVPNPGGEVPSGISAEARIPAREVMAHFLSPAILALSTDGELGVKTVDGEGAVRFRPVELVRAETDGVWVAGLPEKIRLITTGQGFVRDGDRVRVVETAEAAAASGVLAGPPAALPADAAGR
ncbi:efflux RND transporter periplasmic adaptor subunit [Marinimicrococcus flavescens]|uniref:Efflux RND transporter periplasmic adaptor subunit n=1 Tax=Marinimicrococcus flavescens TaxID=3031815 RepID=A0AAP3XS44_9PROT|nr:efflux RND transporter periplasmic adaptor subunit [Marinimicrococcus flavescens]